MKLIGHESRRSPIYEYRVSFYEKDEYRVYAIDEFIVFHSVGSEFKGKKIVNQVEFPLAAIDLFLGTMARYELPLDAGGLGGFKHMSPTVVAGEEVYFDRLLHPHYGVVSYRLKNLSRKSYISSAFDQCFEIFEETMDSGLLAKLNEINDQYKSGTLGEWLAKA